MLGFNLTEYKSKFKICVHPDNDGSVENLWPNILAAEQEFNNLGKIRHQKIRIRVEVPLF